MKKERSLKHLFVVATKHCNRSERCTLDVIHMLQRKGALPIQIEEIIEYLKKKDYINELRYAEIFVMDKFRLNNWGRIKIQYHLKQKKIKDNFIQQALEQIKKEEYIQMLKEIIDKKKKTIHTTDKFKCKTKLLNFATSRGFEKNLIMQFL